METNRKAELPMTIDDQKNNSKGKEAAILTAMMQTHS